MFQIKHALALLGTAALIAQPHAEPQNSNAPKAPALEIVVSINALNTLNIDRKDAATLIPYSRLTSITHLKPNSDFITQINNSTIPNQKLDTDGDGVYDSLLVIADYPAKASLKITVSALADGDLNIHYVPRTQAEMGVRVGGQPTEKGIYQGGQYHSVSAMTMPANHKIGDKLFKYEGFGWESDKIAYRFYFDERGQIDIFGKRVAEPVLTKVGLDGGDYHTLSDWGMDILKVGGSLGLAGIAEWREDVIHHPTAFKKSSVQLNSNPLRSFAIIAQHDGLLGDTPIDLIRKFEISAGSHLTFASITTSTNIPTMAVGIVKHDVEKIENTSRKSEWNYMATYGKQSLAGDYLGMSVFFKHKDLKKITSDQLNELVILTPNNKTLNYYFSGNWSGEPNGLKNKEDYIKQLEATREELNHPIELLD
jgi:hypothetical protein